MRVSINLAALIVLIAFLPACKTTQRSALSEDAAVSLQDQINSQIDTARESSRAGQVTEYWQALMERIRNDFGNTVVLEDPLNEHASTLRPEDVLVLIITSGEFPGPDQKGDISERGTFPTLVVENQQLSTLELNLKLIENHPQPFKEILVVITGHGLTPVTPKRDVTGQIIYQGDAVVPDDHNYQVMIQENTYIPFEKLLAIFASNIRSPDKRLTILLDTCQSAGSHIAVQKFRRDMRNAGTPELGQIGVAYNAIVHDPAVGKKFSPFEQIIVDMLLHSEVYDRDGDGVIDGEEFVLGSDSYVGRKTRDSQDQVVDANVFFKLAVTNAPEASARRTHDWLKGQSWYNQFVDWVRSTSRCEVR